jgi:membrane fusion protein (multidrug efflux system)
MNFQKIFFSGIAILVCCVSCTKKAATTAPAAILSYPVATLKQQDVELKNVYPAVLKGQEDIDIKPRVEGFIDAVYVDEGSIVKKGQALFKISSPSSVQLLESATASYNTAKLDVERMRPLAEKGIISEVRIKTYENNFASAKAALDQAKATVGFTKVTSPVDGIVGAIPFRLGSLVTSSSVLTTVANTNTIIAYFSLNEKDLLEFMRNWEGNSQAEKIKNMPEVKLLLADGSEYEEKGRIETISGVVDATSGSVNFRASFPNTQGLLRSGTSGKIIIPRMLSQVLMVPQKATFNQQDKVLVYKVQGDSVVSKVIKVKSTADGLNYAVLNGLTAGDKIVTDGMATLKNGAKIKEQ